VTSSCTIHLPCITQAAQLYALLYIAHTLSRLYPRRSLFITEVHFSFGTFCTCTFTGLEFQPVHERQYKHIRTQHEISQTHLAAQNPFIITTAKRSRPVVFQHLREVCCLMLQLLRTFYSTSCREAVYCDEGVCLSVCLTSVCVYHSCHVQTGCACVTDIFTSIAFATRPKPFEIHRSKLQFNFYKHHPSVLLLICLT